MKENKLDTKKILLLSFGFFASSLAWSIYNSYVPLILERLLGSAMLIGLLMAMDNVFGVIFQPLFGRWSDRTRTRFGRRMPYIIVGIPVCAVAFVLIPRMPSLWTLIPVLVVFCFVMSVWRSPVVSLMPDITPGPFRSQANGIVNLMGGIGSLIAFLVGGMLFNLGGFPLPFLTSAILMLAALAVLVLFVREPRQAYDPDEPLAKSTEKLTGAELNSLLLILFGVFFWFCGYNAIETFFTLYATSTLEVRPGTATMMLALFSLTFIAFAVPAGLIGARIGRRRTILIGLTGIFALFLPLIFVHNLYVTGACLFLGGVFWACVNINSLPMVVRLGGDNKVGTYIGYYYFFSFAAQIASPIIFGLVVDHLAGGRYAILFPYACLTFALALACLFFVRHGEDLRETTSATEILDGLDG